MNEKSTDHPRMKKTFIKLNNNLEFSMTVVELLKEVLSYQRKNKMNFPNLLRKRNLSKSFFNFQKK